jgi:FKBP-type peptidyl-prolyl cis-trans isomerase FkpA
MLSIGIVILFLEDAMALTHCNLIIFDFISLTIFITFECMKFFNTHFFLLIFIITITAATSCTKTPTANCNAFAEVAPAAEVAALQDYITNANIKADKDSRGFFYKIDSTVAGNTKATVCNSVTVNYTGLLTNGVQFDSNNGVTFPLRGLIKGWIAGIPLVSKGNTIRLYLSPSFGYGAQGSGSIPPGAILIFEIKVLDIQ